MRWGKSYFVHAYRASWPGDTRAEDSLQRRFLKQEFGKQSSVSRRTITFYRVVDDLRMVEGMATRLLLLFLLGTVVVALLGCLHLLPANATWPATAEGRRQGKVDVLLRVESHDEGRDIDDLLAHPTLN